MFVNDHLGYADGSVHGVTTYLANTLSHFDQTRIQAILCVLRSWHPAAERLEAIGIRPIFLGRMKWDPRVIPSLMDLIRKRQVDLLHLTGNKAMLFGRIAAKVTERPTVLHLHDMDPLKGWLRFAQRHCAPKPDCAIVVSNAMRQFAIREFALPTHRVEVLYNGCDLGRFANVAPNARLRVRQELGLREDTPVLGMIGTISELKGQVRAIQALPEILRTHPDAVLIIVGDGPERARCQALARRLGIQDRVYFTGQRNDIPELLAAMDVVSMPSLSEGLPYVALEAGAAGRPVVAFATGGLVEIVRDGETGLLVPCDVGQLARAVARLLTDRDLARALGENACHHAQRFSVEMHVQGLEEIYRAVLQRTRSAARRGSGLLPEPAAELRDETKQSSKL